MYLLLFSVLALMGVIGYLAYGNEVAALLTLSMQQGRPIAVAVQVGLAVAMYSKIGITINPVAAGIEKRFVKWCAARGDTGLQFGQADHRERLLGDAGAADAADVARTAGPPMSSGASCCTRRCVLVLGQMRRVAVRSLLVALATATALAVPNFGFVIGMIGALLSTLTAVVLPVCCYATVHRKTISYAALAGCTALLVGCPVASAVAMYQLTRIGAA